MASAVLLIADIGGYTKFMSVHRINLAHAQDVVAQLLEAVIDGAGRAFTLAKLEGDAAFFYLTLSGDPAKDERRLAETARAIGEVRRAFLRRRAQLDVNRLCSCEGCVQVADLKLKFVAHLGEIAFQKVKRLTELAGVDVILVHRLLKNTVPIPEYLLASDALHQRLPADFKTGSVALEQELEGLGATTTHFTDLTRVVPKPEPVRPSWFAKLWGWVGLTLRSIPYYLGLKKACDGFRNFPS